jgi:hypothetical protein
MLNTHTLSVYDFDFITISTRGIALSSDHVWFPPLDTTQQIQNLVSYMYVTQDVRRAIVYLDDDCD